jgi:D-alanyl-D-alanine carboxypeptidase
LVDYKGAEGLKTGFTNASGFNLISVAKKKGRRVVSVLLGCSSFERRDEFTKNLLDQAFEKIRENRNKKIETKIKRSGFDYKKSEIREDEYEWKMRFGTDE